MRVVTTCPHCTKEVACEVDAPRSTSSLAWFAALFGITLLTAVGGSFVGTMLYAEKVKADIRRDADERGRAFLEAEEQHRKELIKRAMEGR